jgi:hypothetical protein
MQALNTRGIQVQIRPCARFLFPRTTERFVHLEFEKNDQRYRLPPPHIIVTMVSNRGSCRLALVATVLATFSIGRLAEAAFVREPLSLPRWKPQIQRTGLAAPSVSTIHRMAGGFEWEDPAEAFDQAVDNPFKNTDVLVDPQDGMLKIDPARLLAPRMNGSNLYFIGMMGSGKSAVGKIVAKRK